MWWAAFTLGILGSAHCIAMCGALSCVMTNTPYSSKMHRFLGVFTYQLGRIFTYALIGLVFGFFAELMVVLNIQKIVSILTGLILILLFVISYNPLNRIGQSYLFGWCYIRLKSFLTSSFNRAKSIPSFFLGVLNGMIPCGLVYLALVGAITGGTILNGTLFMIFFGMGTLPAMVVFTLLGQSASAAIRIPFRKMIPYVSLCFGLYLIFRGIMIDMPQDVDFWNVVQNPIMCFRR